MKIGDIKNQLFTKYDLDVDINKIRRLEAAGLFKSTRDGKGFRTFTDIEAKDAIRVILLSEIGVDVDTMKKGDFVAVRKRIASIKKIASLLEYEEFKEKKQ